MSDSDTPPPQAVDYSGLPLTEGDPVAFITVDPVGLAHGHIRIIGPNDLCIDTGDHLVTFPAAHAALRVALPKPMGGNATARPLPEGTRQYHHVALQPARGDA